MIQDVDSTLQALLVQKVPIDLTAIDIKFDIPTKEWSATVTRPTINLFLYDVRENHQLRNNQRTVTGSGLSGTLSTAPVRVDLYYMITAWTTDVSDEHQLLGKLLTTLLSFPVLPPEVLQGSMATQPFDLRAWIAQTDRMPNPWDFWGNVEHRMKAGLNFVLTAAVQTVPDQTVQLATQTVLNIAQTNSVS
jgi:hypothetical protein